MGEGNGPPALSPRDIAPRGRHSDRPGSGKIDLQLSRHEILRCWAGTPNQHRQTNRLTAGCELVLHNGNSRSNGERFLAPGYCCVPHAKWLSRYSAAVIPNGAHVWYKGDVGLWWLEKISASTTTDGVYLVRFWDDPGPIELPFSPARYTTSTGAVRGSWCLRVQLASAFARGVQRNLGESRGAAVDS